MKSIENRLDSLEAKSGQKGVVTEGCIAVAKLMSELLGEPYDPQRVADWDRNAPISEESKRDLQMLFGDDTPTGSQTVQFTPEALRLEAIAKATPSPAGSSPVVPDSRLWDEAFLDALANRIMRACVSRIPGARSLTLQQAEELEKSILDELRN